MVREARFHPPAGRRGLPAEQRDCVDPLGEDEDEGPRLLANWLWRELAEADWMDEFEN